MPGSRRLTTHPRPRLPRRSRVVGSLLWIALVVAASASHAAEPTVVLWDLRHIEKVRAGAADSDGIRHALRRLKSYADTALDRGPYSVVFKDELAPSGDRHDYISFSRYWWPNPDTDDGLPYVRRDGVVNRSLVERGDRTPIGMMMDDVEALTLAGYFFDDDRYSRHAAELVRVWFLEAKTRMNPHLRFGQAVPGRAVGRGVGVIDTRSFIRVLDSVELLHSAGLLASEDRAALAEWFRSYLDWLLESDLGQEEEQAENNHGSWHAAQAGRIAVFVGRDDLARQIVTKVIDQRLQRQIDDQGRQPHELKRSISLHYSVFNLLALSTAARVGEAVGLDAWRCPEDDPALLRALRYLEPYLAGEQEWPHPMLKPYKISPRQAQILYLGAMKYQAPELLELLKAIPKRRSETDFNELVYRGAENHE
ncbi:MAG: alginate lyase family protein [Planctomycetota bacterium]